MAFLYPSFLWALGAIAIPIVIHLFQLRRYKKIPFPDVRFLRDVEQQTRNRSKLQHLLVLLCRILVLTFLVLAFAQPYIHSGDSGPVAGQRSISTYIDNSFSMESEGAEGRAVDVARGAAQEAVKTFGQTDRFQVLTSDLSGRQQRLLAREQAIEEISKVQVGPHERLMSQVIARQREALAGSDTPVRKAFIFTDLQAGVMDFQNWTNDTTISTVIIPVNTNDVSNLYIDSAWFATPVRRVNENEVLNVRIRNTGKQNMENIPMRLFLNGKQRAVATFSVPAGDVTDTTLRFTYDRPGFQEARIEIDDSPITFDNSYHLSYEVAAQTNVLIVSGGSKSSDIALQTIYGGDSLHVPTVSDFKGLDLGSIPSFDLIILNQLPQVPSGLGRVLGDMVADGGSVCLIPAADQDVDSYNQFTTSLGGPRLQAWDTTATRVAEIALEHPFYQAAFLELPRNVDLPVVNGHYSISKIPRADPVLKLQGGQAFHSISPFENGTLHVLASPLGEEYGNYIRHALFVAGMLRMAETSRPSGRLSYTIGVDASIPITEAEMDGSAVPHLVGPGGIDIVPEIRRSAGRFNVILHNNDLYAGNYWLTLNEDTLQGIALDHPRAGSDMRRYTPEEVAERLIDLGLDSYSVITSGTKELSVSLASIDQGVKLWRWCILLALLFILTETALLRWMR